MGTFDPHQDASHQIDIEGQDITIKFQKTSPSTGRISWNIPKPAIGCDSTNQAYNGIVITIDGEPINVEKQPSNHSFYQADPTADSNLHAGDKIGTSMVIGAFYDDRTTTVLDITGLTPNTAYYVSGFAASAQAEYHREGVHAYSLPYGNDDQPSTAGYQKVNVNSLLTDPTGLLATETYNFLLGVNGNEASTISVDGALSSTYQDLLDEIKRQVTLLDNPTQSATIPNIGEYFYSAPTNELFQWDGSQHVSVPVLVESSDPTIATVGDYWYDTTTNELKTYDGAAWNVVTFFSYHQDSTTLTCDDYWFDGTTAYNWNGTVWLPLTTYGGTGDPSLAIEMPCTAVWFDEINHVLYQWKTETACDVGPGQWVEIDAVLSLTDPTTLAANAYWYDESTGELKQYDGANWSVVFAQITDVEPTTPAVGLLWYSPEDMMLHEYDGAAWNELEVINFLVDPTTPEAGNLWWNETDDTIWMWDGTTSSWDQVTPFYLSDTDPAGTPTLAKDTAWFNDVLKVWDGSKWCDVTYIDYASDLTSPTVNDFWYNTSTDTWSVWDGATWASIEPTINDVDPYSMTVGTFWYDTTTNTLLQWDGASWITTTFQTTSYTPSIGTQYFDTTSNMLMEWTGVGWQAAVLPVNVTFEDQHIVFTSSLTGTKSSIILEDIDLFLSLQEAVILNPVWGTDGVSGTPTYQEVGIGDDGTADEKREILHSIKAQLGYPVVDVELTKYQLEECLTGAIESLRKRSSNAYRRSFFFLDLKPGQQRYIMSNKTVGFNKIVQISAMYRMQSAFFGAAEGQGIYGQLMLQHLYHQGTFDLVSYHVISEYIELMNQMFATHIVFNWDEYNRILQIHQTVGANERVLVDCVIEKTDQELLKDRYTKTWIEKYAYANACLILAQIRGKYATLPGAGGGVSLNAGELQAIGEGLIEDLMQQLDDFVVMDVENHGMAGNFLIG